MESNTERIVCLLLLTSKDILKVFLVGIDRTRLRVQITGSCCYRRTEGEQKHECVVGNAQEWVRRFPKVDRGRARCEPGSYWVQMIKLLFPSMAAYLRKTWK